MGQNSELDFTGSCIGRESLLFCFWLKREAIRSITFFFCLELMMDEKSNIGGERMLSRTRTALFILFPGKLIYFLLLRSVFVYHLAIC